MTKTTGVSPLLFPFLPLSNKTMKEEKPMGKKYRIHICSIKILLLSSRFSKNEHLSDIPSPQRDFVTNPSTHLSPLQI